MIKTLKNITILIIILTTIIILPGCFFGTPLEQTVTPTIFARGLPSGVVASSVSLTVRDSEGVVIADVTYSSLPERITITVPEGDGLVFELIIETMNVEGSLYFIGTATVDISMDSAVVTLEMYEMYEIEV